MKHTIRLVLGISVVILLTATVASAQGPGNGPRDRMGQGHHEHHTGPGGFEGMRGNMNITGEVNVDEAIVISIHVQPSEEVREQMQNSPRGHDLAAEDLSNTIEIQITSLVEYDDTDGTGYYDNDTVISEILLNSDFLLDPVMSEGENGTEYLIESVDDTFAMYLYLNEADGTVHSWKWSIEMNYPFVENDTSVAILQSISSNNGPLTRDRAMHHNGEMMEGAIEEHMFRDEHPQVPMFFKWDDFAIVDGVTVDVSASRAIIEDRPVLALTIPQGENIFYDPEIGVEIDGLDNAQNLIDGAVLDLADIVRSPSGLGIVLGSLVLLTTFAIARYR
ncbi:MAG: hypothetical protein ACXAE3_11775 [Candidatus Kariarchaeaceae archaeon]|jgi:hypothetical protein